MSNLSPLRVAPGGRYFQTFDGEPFLFIGPNDAITWPGLMGLYRQRDIAGVEAYLQSLADNGVTMLRLMLEYAQGEARYFERPAGKWNPALVRLWDDLLARCERFGLRVLLAPWDNFWMARRWHRHPYNSANGGPASTPAAFFTDEATITATIRRLQFVVERWGGCPAFAAWDLFNEIHPHWGGTAMQQGAVIARLSEAVREAELRFWGWTRPQTISIFGPEPGEEYEDLIFRHPSLDFATTHIYHCDAIDNPRNTVAPALTMARWVRYALERTQGRPYTDTEHGPIDLFNNHRRMMPEEFDDEYERHMMWAHLASGGAGSGMRWPARNPHVLTAGMKYALAGLSAFCKLVDWSNFSPRAVYTEEIQVQTPGVQIFACRDERQAVVWLLRGNAERNTPGILPLRDPLHNVSLTWHGWHEGAYEVAAWNTCKGRPAGNAAVCATGEGHLEIVLPELHQDLALAVCRIT